ncbi:MAG TPA: arylsulfotransferase family protein [Solirubrobacter sp.]|nr:arylsulfotransferase family protein [Solirubrobacter sp.]
MRRFLVGLIVLAVAGGVAVIALASGSGSEPETPDPVVSTAPTPTVPPADPEAIAVYPAPGVRSASPESQISFRGAPASELGEIVVTGSRSGRHSGRLREHSDGEGASFLPDKPFEEGERVTVRTDLDLVGAKDGEYSITIARRARTPKIRKQEPWSKGKGAVQELVTRPDLIPPAVKINTAKPGRADGLIFVAPKGGRGQEGTMILDDTGRLIWFKRTPRDQVATDFRVQEYRGKPVLTWWQGGLIVGDGRGVGMIYDQRYRRVATVRAGNGYSMDLHEFVITPGDTALLIAFDRVEQDLRPLGGPRRGVVITAIVQEVEIETGLVRFEYHSLGSIGLDEGKAPLPKKDGGQYDYIHMNSVALDDDGDFILSARNTSGVYKVDRRSAQLEWRLGGTKPTFKMERGSSPAWQHDARPLDDGTLLIYDNGSSPPVHKMSRALTLKVDERAKTASVVRELTHPRKLLASTQGNAQPLPNGNTFVGWGSQRYFTEYDADGKLVFDAELARGNDSYRAFRMPWEGRPAERPRVVARASGGTVRATASWNGATEVARWQLLAGPSEDALEPVADAEVDGFETTVRAETDAPMVAMRALDADGKTLATSAAVQPE